MQLSDREIQNTIDLLKRKDLLSEEEASSLSAEDLEAVREVVRRIEELPEIREDKVERVRKALSSSSYNITGKDIAKKLIGRIISDKLR